MHSLLKAACVALAALPLVAQAAGQSILVLDASGSMWGQVKGKPKVEIAREAVATMLKTWPADEPLGLIAYGHRRKGDCADIEVISAPKLLDKSAFTRDVNALQAKGMTPITASVRLAAEQLKSTEQKATVILVSDGEETCKADPCALGRELENAGVDFTAHVIGFDLPEGPARAQLQCLASSTGGRYIEARDAGELNDALGKITQPTIATQPVEPTKEAKPTKGCELFAEDDFTGASLVIGYTTYENEMPAGWNNRVRSLRCSADAGLYLYNDNGREGEYLMIENGGSRNKLGGAASSYIYFGEWGEDEDAPAQ